METVTVACKLPLGLLAEVRGADGIVAAKHLFKGPPRPLDLVEQTHDQFKSTGGYGLTSNVPADFFARWLSDNMDNKIVTGGLIFSASNVGHAQGQGKEQSELLTGQEPLDPNKPAAGIKPLDHKE